MRRREFLGFVGGLSAWPLTAPAQPRDMPVIGFLYSGSPELGGSILTAFRTGLSESGFVEGRNVLIEYRWAHDDITKFPELAADLVDRRVAVIATLGTPTSALPAKAATTAIPIVFRTGGDPVQLGLVNSLSRPGGNITA